MKAKLFNIILCFFFVFGTCLNVQNIHAVNKEFSDNVIPEKMQPYSEIIYTSDTTYEVVKGGHTDDLSVVELELPSYLQKVDESNVISEVIVPVKGMRVTYASDGLIFDIIYPDGYSNKSKVRTSSSKGAILPDGLSLVAKWGSYPNKLYYDSSMDRIMGVGRATTFSDTIGQGNHKLKKGEVATKLDYDNCQLGLKVEIITENSAGEIQSHEMKKWDAGGMPNAIVDIWKTGVSEWGYTWSSSFSMPKQVTIFHANLDINGNKLY